MGDWFEGRARIAIHFVWMRFGALAVLEVL
mgnify:CR=1 FL=1